MLNSKLDLYKSGWLELVFDNRNKAYGAYDLRQHYANNMLRAMGITFLFVAVLSGASILIKPRPVPVVQTPQDPTTVVNITEIKPPVIIPKKPLTAETPKPAATVKTTQNLPPVVVADEHAKPPVPNINLTGNVGQTTTPGAAIDPGPIEVSPGTGTQPAVPDTKVYSVTGVDEMPEPVGGENAWAKFLRKNLRFPDQAQDAQVSGRVILSFIIEKDGSLSNITVERGAGYGFDEEATRVLKLAKAWKPGKQNGLPVRVKYDIPINFQLAE